MIFQLLSVLFLTITTNVTAESKPIFHAIAQNDSASVEKILKKDEYHNTVNKDGQTILHVAVLANNKKATKTILKSKQINVNQLDNDGKTAMDYAVEYKQNKLIRKLYKHKGKVTTLENEKYAKKIITRPFKILFFIGLALTIPGIGLIYLATQSGSVPQCGPGVGIIYGPIGLGLGGSGIIFILTGASGWVYRAQKNLLLAEPYIRNS